MNILVIMPKFVEKAGDSYIFPVGIAYISASLKKAGYRVTALNLNHTDEALEQLLHRVIGENSIDIVCTGTLVYFYQKIKQIIDTAKAVKPEVVTVVGGGLITSAPLVVMGGMKNVDIGVIGEGEITICDIVDALQNGRDISTVRGIVYREKGIPTLSQERGDIENIDDLPYPDYEGFDYFRTIGCCDSTPGISSPIYIVAGRSCPYTCSFCFHTCGKKYRQRSLDSFFSELDWVLSKYRVDYVDVMDELFALNRDRLAAFCKRIKPYNIKWMVQLRVDIVTEELLLMLKDAGCMTLSYGLESADNRILKSMNKHITVEQIERALRLTTEIGFYICGNFIFGDSAETQETVENTLRWWREHPDFQIYLGMIAIFPGTPLFSRAFEMGKIPDKLEYIEGGQVFVNATQMPDEDYYALIQRVEEIRFTEYTPPTSIKYLGCSNDIHRFEGNCRKCGHLLPFQAKDLVSSFLLLNCPNCFAKQGVVPLKYVDLDFQGLLGKGSECGKRVAVWGVTQLTRLLFQASPLIDDERVLVLDRDPLKQKQPIYGHRVHPTEAMQGKDIDTVIVAAVGARHQIAEEIRAKYPKVKTIWLLSEMINLDRR